MSDTTFAGRPLKLAGLDLSRPAAPVDEPTAAAEIAPLKAAVAAAIAQRERAESVLASVWPEYRWAHSNPPVYTELVAWRATSQAFFVGSIPL